LSSFYESKIRNPVGQLADWKVHPGPNARKEGGRPLIEKGRGKANGLRREGVQEFDNRVRGETVSGYLETYLDNKS